MANLNGLYFHHSRIWSGIDEKLFWYYIGEVGEVSKSLSRKKQYDEDTGVLLNDISSTINRNKRFCAHQLQLLKLSYDQILSYQTTTLNIKLQKFTIWLSIVVTVLTIVTLIPESIRIDWFTKLWDWLNNSFSYKNLSTWLEIIKQAVKKE